MQDTQSRRWSVGCCLVMWQYNTQQHRTVGDIPYRLMFGQHPISSLLLETGLIDSLATEAQLNQVVEYEGMVEAIDSDDEGSEAVAIEEGENAAADEEGENAADAV